MQVANRYELAGASRDDTIQSVGKVISRESLERSFELFDVGGRAATQEVDRWRRRRLD
jgi:hypothetical protein